MHTDLQKLEQKLLQSVAGLSATQTQATPTARPGAWNIQQIVEHLVLTYKVTAVEFEARIAKGRPVKTKSGVRQRIAQFVLITMGRFPRGFEAPKPVAPSGMAPVKSGEELGERVSSVLTRLDELANAAETMFGAKRSVSHLRLGPLSIAQWRRFHLVHGLHHLRQIETIRREHGFGSAKSAAA